MTNCGSAITAAERVVDARLRVATSAIIAALAASETDPSAAAMSVAADFDAAPRATGRAEGPSTIAGVWALFVGLGLLMVGNGLNGAVIGIRSGAEGFSVAVTGVIMAGYFAGFLLAPSVVVRMIPSVGHIRVFAGLASTASSAVLVHAVAVFPLSWTVMRFVFGFCMAGLYIVIESWLGEMTTAATRGRTMAIYMIVSSGGLGLGQVLIAVGDPTSFQLFILSSVLVSMALVPVTLAATTKAPIVSVPEPVSIRELIDVTPSAVIGSFMVGASAGILLGLGAVYATTIGLSLDRTAFFLVAPMLGAIAFQFPIGRLSDKISRRTVIFGVAIGGAVVSIVLMFLPEQSVLVPVMMVALGGMLFPLYALVVSFALDWVDDIKIVGASATLVRLNGAGALAGPLIAAPLMSAFGASWFFWSLAISFSVVVVYVAYRLIVKDAMPVERQKAFVPFPARAGYLAAAIVTKPVRKVTKIATGKHVGSRKHPHASRPDPDD